jgi:uncharacterized protein YndB with AHSA1/START domain
MSIAPVTATVEVRQPPTEAFELFVSRISDWWHNRSGIGAKPLVSVTVEPFAGGRWFETDEDGTDTPWGSVIAWEPPSRLLLAWELDASFRPTKAMMTEVEITFVPTAAGGTRVALEHRNLERFGADAERVAQSIGRGWPTHLNSYAAFVNDPVQGDPQ